MTWPVVTVLIDTYNYGHFIEEAIESVLTQDFPSEQMEVLVVDDGSTDDTPEHVKKYGGRIRYFRKSNGGQASAFNFGLRRSRGDIVTLLDADDYWLPGKLRRVVEEFAKHPDAGMVYHKMRELDSERAVFKEGRLPLFSGFLPSKTKDLLSYALYPTSFLAFRRSLMGPLLPVPEKLTIQADAYLSGLTIFLAPIVGVAESLAVYRLHGRNLFFDGTEGNVVRHELRLQTRAVLIETKKKWLAERGYDLQRTDLRTMFKQMDVSQEQDKFVIAPPGRIRTSRHLFAYAQSYGPQLTWRHRAVTYLNAAGSLAVGYKNVHLLDEWRLAIKRSFAIRRSLREPRRFMW